MTKKTLNQNAKYVQKLINTIEPDFNFSNKPINRLETIDTYIELDAKTSTRNQLQKEKIF